MVDFTQLGSLFLLSFQARDVCGENTTIILRFLGTSPSSSDILLTLQSIIMQIGYVYKMHRYLQKWRMKITPSLNGDNFINGNNDINE